MSQIARKPLYLDDSDWGLFNANRHRENVEYLLELQGAKSDEIRHVIYEGFRESLQLQLDAQVTTEAGFQQLQSTFQDVGGAISDGFDRLCSGLEDQLAEHRKSYELLQEVLGTLKNPRATEAAECSRQAADNIRLAIGTRRKDRVERLLNEAVELLEKALEISDFDAKSHFDYAWLCRNYLDKPREAMEHFDTSALRAMAHEKRFAAFALRNFSAVAASLGEPEKSIEALEEAVGLFSEPPAIIRIELARYALAADREELAVSVLRDLISSDSLAFSLAQADPDLAASESVSSLLGELYTLKLDTSCNSLKEFVNNSLGGTASLRNEADEASKEARTLSYENIDPFFESLRERLSQESDRSRRIEQIINEAHPPQWQSVLESPIEFEVVMYYKTLGIFQQQRRSTGTLPRQVNQDVKSAVNAALNEQRHILSQIPDSKLIPRSQNTFDDSDLGDQSTGLDVAKSFKRSERQNVSDRLGNLERQYKAANRSNPPMEAEMRSLRDMRRRLDDEERELRDRQDSLRDQFTELWPVERWAAEFHTSDIVREFLETYLREQFFTLLPPDAPKAILPNSYIQLAESGISCMLQDVTG